MSGSSRVVAAAGLGTLAVAIAIGRFAFTPLFPLMQEEAGVSMSQGAALASANYIGYLVGALTAIGARVQPVFAIRWSLLLISAVTVAMGFCPSHSGWLALRAVAGAASAWGLIFASGWTLEKLAASGRGDLSGVMFAGVGTGIAAVGVLVAAATRAGADAFDTWVLLGIVAFAATALISVGMCSPAAPVAAKRVAPRLGVVRESLGPIVAYGLLGFGYIIPATFLPVMAKQLVGHGASFEWAWPVFGIAAAISTLVSARLAATPRQMWIAGSLIMAAGLAAPAVSPGLATVLASALLVGATFMVITLAGLQCAREIGGERATALIAAMTSAFAAGQILGPLVANLLFARHQNFTAALIAASAAMLFGALILARRGSHSTPIAPVPEKTR